MSSWGLRARLHSAISIEGFSDVIYLQNPFTKRAVNTQKDWAAYGNGKITLRVKVGLRP